MKIHTNTLLLLWYLLLPIEYEKFDDTEIYGKPEISELESFIATKVHKTLIYKKLSTDFLRFLTSGNP